MKHYIILILLLAVVLLFGQTKPSEAKSVNYETHNAGLLSLNVYNNGSLSNLHNPYSGMNLMSQSGQWISAKKYRRNNVNQLLYWLSPIPGPGNDQMVTENDPLWNPNLLVVTDTLSTVAYDGDYDLTEFLPAYNCLSQFNPTVQYDIYNEEDRVLNSILGYPAPSEFQIPDPLGTYCFSIPQQTSFTTPGFETLSAYYYDYCPFGTVGERDWGSNSIYNQHISLGLAIHRESFSWPLQNYADAIIIRNTIINTNEVDTLFDLAISEFIDCDIYPEGQSANGYKDDVSGYVMGNYEFAYSRDWDGDNGSSSLMLGSKLIIPEFNAKHSCWYWRMGQGPDDSNPRNLNPTKRTANEKYYLATGRNPDSTYNLLLRYPQTGTDYYEQPVGNDTRFLNCLYGTQPSEIEFPEGRLCLAPSESLVYYSVYFTGTSLDELRTRCLFWENFINNDFNLGDVAQTPCLPYLYRITPSETTGFNLFWTSYSAPDNFIVKYKLVDSPSDWEEISLPGNAHNYTISAINPQDWYEVKLASVYNSGVDEIYLESRSQTVNYTQMVDISDEVQIPLLALYNYPNPFNPETHIQFSLSEPSEVSVDIYNLKGQRVKTLFQGFAESGMHTVLWNGKDNNNYDCASGVYFYKLQTKDKTLVRKMLMLK
ncbi:MAG: T9SS type A sorting domain-containing protein [Candidatus Cloacimonas sp.]